MQWEQLTLWACDVWWHDGCIWTDKFKLLMAQWAHLWEIGVHIVFWLQSHGKWDRHDRVRCWKEKICKNHIDAWEDLELERFHIWNLYPPLVLGGICRWFLLFQEYEFEVLLKPGKLNSGLDYLSRILMGRYFRLCTSSYI